MCRNGCDLHEHTSINANTNVVLFPQQDSVLSPPLEKDVTGVGIRGGGECSTKYSSNNLLFKFKIELVNPRVYLQMAFMDALGPLGRSYKWGYLRPSFRNLTVKGVCVLYNPEESCCFWHCRNSHVAHGHRKGQDCCLTNVLRHLQVWSIEGQPFHWQV